jgi:hypothetical protein
MTLLFSRLSAALFMALLCAASATGLPIANASFEAPAIADAVFDQSPDLSQQGGSGWLFGNFGVVGVINPPSDTYVGAGGGGTPQGADGAQVAFLFSNLLDTAALTFVSQDVAGAVLNPGTVYTLTIAVGRRLPGNQYGLDTYGGYDIQLLAGTTIIARETDAFSPTAGSFSDRVLVIDSATLSPALYGEQLTIRLGMTQSAAISDFDNVRFSAVPEPSALALLCTGGALGLGAWCRRRQVEVE